jgi:hypothetical protein
MRLVPGQAGPFHPSVGEKFESKLDYNALQEKLLGFNPTGCTAGDWCLREDTINHRFVWELIGGVLANHSVMTSYDIANRMQQRCVCMCV